MFDLRIKMRHALKTITGDLVILVQLHMENDQIHFVDKLPCYH